MAFVKYWTAPQFFAEFTEPEVAAFYTVVDAPGGHMIRLMRDMIMSSTTVLASDSPLVTAGLNALVAAGVITSERMNEILTEVSNAA